MSVKFLSEEWAAEVTSRLRASEAVAEAAKGQSITIQQVVTGVPEGGHSRYYFRLVEGVPEVVPGEAEGAEVTLTQTYETAVALDKGELNPQAAFLQGKLKVQGNLMRAVQLQGLVQTLPGAVADLEREY